MIPSVCRVNYFNNSDPRNWAFIIFMSNDAKSRNEIQTRALIAYADINTRAPSDQLFSKKGYLSYFSHPHSFHWFQPNDQHTSNLSGLKHFPFRQVCFSFLASSLIFIFVGPLISGNYTAECLHHFRPRSDACPCIGYTELVWYRHWACAHRNHFTSRIGLDLTALNFFSAAACCFSKTTCWSLC